jgi:hypothetical protein
VETTTNSDVAKGVRNFFTQRSIFLLLIILLIFTKHYVIMDDTLQNLTLSFTF